MTINDLEWQEQEKVKAEMAIKNFDPTRKPHGGKRKNAGRKHKYGEPAKKMLVPVRLVSEIEKLIARNNLAMEEK